MTPQVFLDVSEDFALGALVLAVLLTLIRLFRGPGLADRIVALDLLTSLSVSLIGLMALRNGIVLQLDIALALCLVGFVSTIALARYLLAQAVANVTGANPPDAPEEPR
jgi:multicomponent Na+:H+ antiporter subunit F